MTRDMPTIQFAYQPGDEVYTRLHGALSQRCAVGRPGDGA